MAFSIVTAQNVPEIVIFSLPLSALFDHNKTYYQYLSTNTYCGKLLDIYLALELQNTPCYLGIVNIRCHAVPLEVSAEHC